MLGMDVIMAKSSLISAIGIAKERGSSMANIIADSATPKCSHGSANQDFL
jgi:hypothetical protein